MTPNPAYQAHVDFMKARCAELARQLVAQTQEALRASSVDIAMAQDRKLLFQVAEALRAHRQRLEADLCALSLQAIDSALAGGRPRSDAPSPAVQLEELTLVDEDQAEREIDISRTVQLIELQAEWELRELQAFTAAMLPEGSRNQPQPFRPATYAQALSEATLALGLMPMVRNMLLRVAGRELANLLRGLYGQACERLRGQGLQPQAYRAVRTSARPRHGAVDVTQPGALHTLLHKVPTPASGDDSLKLNMQGAATEQQVLALLSGLFAQMSQDDALQPIVRQLIDALQPSVQRVALQDPQLMSSAQHPTWRLINQMAAYATGYSEPDHAELAAFVRFVQPQLAALASAPQPDARHFALTLQRVQQFIEQQAQAQLKGTQATVARLAQADQRLSLQPILRQQVAQQLRTMAQEPLPETIQSFLLDTWVDVLSHAMTADNPDEPESQGMLAAVDDLILSLQQPASPSARDALRQSLPDLIARLKRGMAQVAMPAARQSAVLDELMALHSQHLLAPPRAARAPVGRHAAPRAAAPDAAAELVRQMREEMAQHDASQPHSSHPQVVDTNVGTLPTVPMRYADEADGPLDESPSPDWVGSLERNTWCKLFLQGQWTTARLLWTSANRQFFVFTSNHNDGLHSLTRGALVRLRAEGLATSLEERSLMQRAVDSLLQDLDD